MAFWIPMLIGAGMGAMQGEKNRKQQREHDKFRKEVIAMSPWTGMQDPGAVQKPGMLSSIIKGGATGALLGSMLPAGGAAAGAGGGAASGAAAGGAGAGALGGTGMAASLGQQGANFAATMPQAVGGTAANTGVWAGMGAGAGGASSAGALGASQAGAGLSMPTMGQNFLKNYGMYSLLNQGMQGY